MTDEKREPVPFSSPGKGFARREITVAAGCSRDYVEADWCGALVAVASGRIELETTGGARETFKCGDILWLTGLSIRTLNNRWSEPAVLVALTRSAE